MPIILICLILTYAGLGAFVWQRHKKYGSKAYPLKAELAVLGVALLVHGAALLIPVLRDNMLITGLGYSVSLIVWLTLMMYRLGSFFYCLRELQLLLYPYATVALSLRWMFPDKFVGYQISDLPFMLHIISSLLACGLFRIVALFAVLVLLLNRNLHRRWASALSNLLPPLLSPKKLIFHGMLAGFVLLTYPVVSGTFFAESVFDKPLIFTHRTMFGILSWLIYGGLLLKHSMTTWHGKKTVIWAIVGLVSLLPTYVDSKFVLEIVLHRQGQRDGKAV